MIYRVILVGNGIYKKTLHKSKTKETAFLNFHSLLEANKKIKFPKKFVNSNKIKPIEYKICVTKPTEPDDKFRILRDTYGRTYKEKPIGDWTILSSEPYNFEETFWIYGFDSKIKRPTIAEVIKKLVIGAYKKNFVKQIIVVNNKLIIHSEEQFDMVICKCMDDAQRLHHTLAAVAKKQKLKSLLFMGTATKATVSQMYQIIMEHTGWPYKKVKRTTTRP